MRLLTYALFSAALLPTLSGCGGGSSGPGNTTSTAISVDNKDPNSNGTGVIDKRPNPAGNDFFSYLTREVARNASPNSGQTVYINEIYSPVYADGTQQKLVFRYHRYGFPDFLGRLDNLYRLDKNGHTISIKELGYTQTPIFRVCDFTPTLGGSTPPYTNKIWSFESKNTCTPVGGSKPETYITKFTNIGQVTGREVLNTELGRFDTLIEKFNITQNFIAHISVSNPGTPDFLESECWRDLKTGIYVKCQSKGSTPRFDSAHSYPFNSVEWNQTVSTNLIGFQTANESKLAITSFLLPLELIIEAYESKPITCPINFSALGKTKEDQACNPTSVTHTSTVNTQGDYTSTIKIGDFSSLGYGKSTDTISISGKIKILDSTSGKWTSASGKNGTWIVRMQPFYSWENLSKY